MGIWMLWKKELWLLPVLQGTCLGLHFDSTAKHVGDRRPGNLPGKAAPALSTFSHRPSVWDEAPPLSGCGRVFACIESSPQRAQLSHRRMNLDSDVLLGPSLASWPDRRVPAKDRAPRYLSGSQLFCDSKEARFNQAMQIYNVNFQIASASIPLGTNGTKHEII